MKRWGCLIPKGSGSALYIIAHGGDKLTIRVRYSKDKFDRDSIVAFVRDLNATLQRIAMSPSLLLCGILEEDVFLDRSALHDLHSASPDLADHI